jgi:hypothetical protein
MIPPAGGETPDAALRQAGSMDMDEDVDVSMDGSKEKHASHQMESPAFMKVIAGDDGHHVAVPNLSTQNYSIKIGLTLYKVQQNIYLLDFQKKTGDAFSFMTLCANIITELKTLSAASRQQQLLQQQQAAAAAAQQQALQQRQG